METAIDSSQQKQKKLSRTQGIRQVTIRCALCDKDGNLWFGTSGEGVYRYDGTFFTQFTTKDGLPHNSVWSIMEDKNGIIWIGTTNGLCKYDGKNIRTLVIPKDIFYTKSADTYYNDWSTENTVWSILQDKSGMLWVGTGDGMYCYNGKYFNRFPGNAAIINEDSLNLKMVDGMLQDDSGIIWFASGMLPGSEGFICFDGKSLKSFKLRGQEWIYNILDDKTGKLWLATRHNGVVKYDGLNFNKVPVGSEVGLALLMDARGNIWFSCGQDNTGPLWRYDGKTTQTLVQKMD